MKKFKQITTRGKQLGEKTRKKLIDKTSDLLSAPAQFKSKRQISQGNRDLDVIKQHRKIPKSANSFGPDGVTNVGKIRASYQEVKSRLSPKKKQK